MKISGVMPNSVGIILTTYNRPDFLEAVLRSVEQQTIHPQEIIVADDGSSPITTELLGNYVQRLPIKHCWLPDNSFRAARSRNIAITKSKSKYLIFVDGDMLLPPTFVENHLRLSQPGKIVAGNRVLLSKDATKRLLNRADQKAHLYAFKSMKFLQLRLGKLRDLIGNDWKKVRTCNLSLFKDDILKAEGFDESFIGWGREDSDFIVRCIHNGFRIRNGRFAITCAHLWHEESPRFTLSHNEVRLNLTLSERLHKPTKSIVQQL